MKHISTFSFSALVLGGLLSGAAEPVSEPLLTKNPERVLALQSEPIDKEECDELSESLSLRFDTLEFCRRHDYIPAVCNSISGIVYFQLYKKVSANSITGGYESSIDFSDINQTYGFTASEIESKLVESEKRTLRFASYNLSDFYLEDYALELDDDSLSAKILSYPELEIDEKDWLSVDQNLTILSTALSCDLAAKKASLNLTGYVDAEITEISKGGDHDDLWRAYQELQAIERHPSWSDRDYAIVVGHTLSQSLSELSSGSLVEVSKLFMGDDFNLIQYENQAALKDALSKPTQYKQEIPFTWELR